MFKALCIKALMSVVAAMSFCDFAFAQPGFPRIPNAGGSANAELQQIYREDIGTGYTGASLNQIALNNARAQVNYYGQATRPTGPRLGSGAGSFSLASKPFANYTPEPSVSPYLNLFREDFDGNSDLNYQTLVQPILQQQQVNRQVQRQNEELNRRLQSLAAQSDFNPQGSKTQYPTGHQTTFMYYGHYYSMPTGRRR